MVPVQIVRATKAAAVMVLVKKAVAMIGLSKQADITPPPASASSMMLPHAPTSHVMKAHAATDITVQELQVDARNAGNPTFAVHALTRQGTKAPAATEQNTSVLVMTAPGPTALNGWIGMALKHAVRAPKDLAPMDRAGKVDALTDLIVLATLITASQVVEPHIAAIAPTMRLKAVALVPRTGTVKARQSS